MSKLKTKKDYIEGVVKEHIGSITSEITANLLNHQEAINTQLQIFESTILILTDRIVELENNQLSVSLRRDALLAIIYNLIAISQYQNGYEAALDTVTPLT